MEPKIETKYTSDLSALQDLLEAAKETNNG